MISIAGIGHASAMYKRGIRVCTGTGIGASLSTCIQNPNWYDVTRYFDTYVLTFANQVPFLDWL